MMAAVYYGPLFLFGILGIQFNSVLENSHYPSWQSFLVILCICWLNFLIVFIEFMTLAVLMGGKRNRQELKKQILQRLKESNIYFNFQ